jgi:hypothetical protein
VQQVKAYVDLRQFDEAQECVERVDKGLERFPIWASHLFEVVGQVKTLHGDPQAAESFRAALEAADKSGILGRRETLLRYVGPTA